jgi:hypothetical protein
MNMVSRFTYFKCSQNVPFQTFNVNVDSTRKMRKLEACVVIVCTKRPSHMPPHSTHTTTTTTRTDMCTSPNSCCHATACEFWRALAGLLPIIVAIFLSPGGRTHWVVLQKLMEPQRGPTSQYQQCVSMGRHCSESVFHHGSTLCQLFLNRHPIVHHYRANE